MRAGLVLIFLTWLWAGFAFAQTVEEFPALQQKWELTAQRAEDVINSETANEAELLAIRRSLDSERQEIVSYVGEAEARLAPLLDQQETLGPVPESGSEPPEVANVRADLQAQIDRENGPLVAARQIRERINSDIVSIDRIQRKRFSDQLLTRTGFPLSTDAIFEFLDDLHTTVTTAWQKFTGRWVSLTAAGYAVSVLPANIAAALLGLGIIVFGQRLFRHYIVLRADKYFSGFLTRKLLSAINVFGIILSGALLILWALERTFFVGVDSEGLFQALRFILYTTLIAIWISRIARHDNDEFGTSFVLVFAALLFAIDWQIIHLIDVPPWDVISITVLHFILAVLYFPLAYRMSKPAQFYHYFERPESAIIVRVTEALRAILRYSNWLILLLALVGYFALSRQLLVALAASFGLSLLGYWVFETVTELGFNVISRLRGDHVVDSSLNPSAEDDEDRNPLWPVLVAVAVIATVLPLILIAWGVDPNLLLEIWVTLVQGFTIGGIRLSLGAIAGFILAFTIGIFVVRGLQALLSTFILPRTRMDVGARAALVSLFGYFGFSMAALVAFSAAGFDLGSLAVIFGALSVGIGFGLQNIVSNFVSGIILLIERPIKKGDWVSVSGNEGFVRDIKVRATEIETFDRATVIIPNSDLISQPVLNWVHSDKNARVRVPIGVAYEADPNEVRDVLLDIARDSRWAMKIPAPQVIFMGFGASSIDFELRFHIRSADDQVQARSDINFAIFEHFKARSIDIPFPITDVRITTSGAS